MEIFYELPRVNDTSVANFASSCCLLHRQFLPAITRRGVTAVKAMSHSRSDALKKKKKRYCYRDQNVFCCFRLFDSAEAAQQTWTRKMWKHLVSVVTAFLRLARHRSIVSFELVGILEF